MTDDREGYVEAWARANKGRRVRIARRLNPDWKYIGTVGVIAALDEDGTPCIGVPGQYSEQSAAAGYDWLTPGQYEPIMYMFYPEDVDFLDGAPAREPRLVNGAWTWDGKDGSGGGAGGGTFTPDDTRPQKLKPLPDYGNGVDERRRERDALNLAATQALHFLAELVPLPGWSAQTERRLLDVARGLKEALKGGDK